MAAVKRSSRRWWAAVGVGAAACVGCCAAVPLLAAVGLAGSGAVLVGLGWLEPIGVALIIGGLIGLGVNRIRLRRGATSCAVHSRTRPAAANRRVPDQVVIHRSSNQRRRRLLRQCRASPYRDSPEAPRMLQADLKVR